MKQPDKLFQLIKSLTKTEKGYFKKYSTKHIVGGKNNYIRLFEVLDLQKEYNEQKVKTVFKGENLIKHLSSEKDYLYQTILNSLIAYKSESSPTYKLYKLLNQINILYEKAFYNQCNKLISKAKTLASQTDEFSILLELIKLEKKLIVFESNLKTLQTRKEAIIKSEKHILQAHKNFNEVWGLYAEIIIANRSAGFKSLDEVRNDFEKIIQNPLLQDIQKITSSTAKAFYYQIYSVYYFAIQKFDEWFKVSNDLVSFLEANPALINAQPYRYVISLGNLLISYKLIGNSGSSFKKNLNKYRAIKTKDKSIETLIFTTSFNLELTTNTYAGKFDEAIEVAKHIEQKMPYYEDYIGPAQKAAMYYNMSFAYFGKEDYSKALDWANKVLYDIKLDIRQDIYCVVKLYSLIIHYELNNMLLINSYAVSTRKYLDNREVLTQTEVIFLKFLKRISNIYNKQKLTSEFEKFYDELQINFQLESEKSFLEYFDILYWVQSKIEKRPFQEIIKEKNANK